VFGFGFGLHYKSLAMKCLSFVLLVTITAIAVADAKQHKDDIHSTQDIHFDDIDDDKDFDFDDKKSTSKSSPGRELRQMYNWWTIEDLCKDVKCKSWEYCVIKSKGVAVCVHKKETNTQDSDVFNSKSSKKSVDLSLDDDDDDEDDDEYEEDIEEKSTYSKSDDNALKQCTPCPVVRPEFICGADNATYSSKCRLDFHNCVHRSDIRMECSGFCPCIKSAKKPKTEKKWSDTRKAVKEDKQNESDLKYKKSKFYYKLDKQKKMDANRDNMQNSVLPHIYSESTFKEHKKCSTDELKSIGSRLLDWFSVVIAEQKKDHSLLARKHSSFKIPDCQPQVSYMFHYFDTNGDFRLSQKELYYIEHDQNEHCLQPYLIQCDEDNDQYLSAYEWCTCFDKKSQPCLNALKHTKKGLLGAYSPKCDNQGFYKPMQCHASSGLCWCVDRNGVEFTNTRRRGTPDCKGLLNRARHRTSNDPLESREDIDVDDDGDDDDDNDGSGDHNIAL